MRTDSAPLEQARALLRLKPPPGAEARVLRRVLERKRAPERRPLRPLVLVFSLLVSATAAAVGGAPLARWVGAKLATEPQRGPELPPHASVPPRTTSQRAATPHAPVPNVPTPSDATP
ncbi:MAG TPA: hypothetical protein VGQ57_14760, partial [Polyangiaceae bacterium]|nr:hypothetical protein [Polyangiaceae bacterium]